ncbi:MAG: hypothetical protein WC496_10210 [Phycisphaerae bacterium]|jgi:hypothetical protein
MAQELITDKKPALSGLMMLIFWWAMVLFALQASTHMVGAGDTWVAMACGRHFINHGVNTVEPFSANSHKPGPTAEEVKTWPKWAQWITDKVGLDTVKYWHPTGWVNQNWLTHVFFYWVTHDSPVADAETFDKPIEGQKITYDSLVYWKYALYIITVIVVYYTGRALGVNPALSATFACFALFIGRTFFDIRPAGFSNMLTAVLLFIFVLAVYKSYLYIWLIVPLTVLWCNLHGGFVYVFVVLVPFIGLHLLTLLPKKISLCVYYSLGWLFLYALALKFLGHETIKTYLTIKISPLNDVLLFFILEMIVLSILSTFIKDIKLFIFYAIIPLTVFISVHDLTLAFLGYEHADFFSSAGEVLLFISGISLLSIVLIFSKNKPIIFYILTSLLIFIALCGRFFPQGIERFVRYDPVFREYIRDGRQTFFVVFIGFAVIAMLLGAFKERLKNITVRGWWHTVAAAVVAFVAMIIFNPFHLTNLTHTFVATVGDNAKTWKTVNEWHPAFEWGNPVGDEIPFLVMYIIAWVLLAFWMVCLLLKPRVIIKKGKAPAAELPDNQQYDWPMIDLPMMFIASLTIYMAIGSRRFIPVAAIAACPFIAMFIDAGIKMIAATVNLRKTGRAVLSPFPMAMQRYFAAAAFAVVLFLTVWWGYWYKTIYLDPWPDSHYLTSVFMRMSASYAKPFRACQFVRDNKLKGTVFNYWTEGGFIAYGQIPDPNTGKTPLRLYMDGRAQAAYNTATYHRWMYIMGGGDPVRAVERAGRNFTQSDYEAIGDWIDKQFQKENVWVVFMPSAQFDSVFIRGLAVNPSWRPVFMDDEQRLYVDIKTEQGLKLYTGIFNGNTKFPDKFSRLFTVGYNLLRLQGENDVNNTCELIIQALMDRPSPAAVIELLQAAARYPQLRSRTTEVFNRYFEDFIEKKQTYMKQDGFRDRLVTMMMIGDYLKRINPASTEKYEKYYAEFVNEQIRIGKTSRW